MTAFILPFFQAITAVRGEFLIQTPEEPSGHHSYWLPSTTNCA